MCLENMTKMLLQKVVGSVDVQISTQTTTRTTWDAGSKVMEKRDDVCQCDSWYGSAFAVRRHTLPNLPNSYVSPRVRPYAALRCLTFPNSFVSPRVWPYAALRCTIFPNSYVSQAAPDGFRRGRGRGS